MGFALVIVMTGLQVLMPSAFFPEQVGDAPLYMWSIIACTLVSIPGLLKEWSLKVLLERPISAFVLGILASVFCASMARLNFLEARMAVNDFGKIILYYFLFVANVNTPRRLDQFLLALLVMIVVLAGASMLTYYGYLDIPSMKPLDRTDEHGVTKTGIVRQMQANGVFADPNDFCLALVMGMLISLYRLLDQNAGGTRYLYGLTLLGLGYGVSLTQSRGGFLGMLVAMLILFRARFGARRAAMLSLLAVPLMFVLFSGRSTKLDTNGTGRSQLWVYSFATWKEVPLFGRGYRMSPDYLDGLVPHNTYLELLVDEGLFGATCFIGIFVVAFRELSRRQPPLQIVNPNLRRFRPILQAILAGYAAGMMSISRSYIIPTYMLFGIASTAIRFSGTYPPVPHLRLDRRLLVRCFVTTLVVLGLINLYVRIFARFGD